MTIRATGEFDVKLNVLPTNAPDDSSIGRMSIAKQFRGLRVDQFDEIKRRGIDGEAKLVAGLRAWFQCVVFFGFFHGDVHAGTVPSFPRTPRAWTAPGPA